MLMSVAVYTNGVHLAAMQLWFLQAASAMASALGPWSQCAEVDVKESRSDLGPWSIPSASSREPIPSDLGPWSIPSASSGEPVPPAPLKGAKRKKVDVSSTTIVDLANVSRGPALTTKASTRASDPAQIKSRWMGPGRCVCAAHTKKNAPPCHRKVPLPAVTRASQTLATMSVAEKAFVFFGCYHDQQKPESDIGVGESMGQWSRMSRRQWSIEDHNMCYTNYCHMLSISPSTVREFVQTEPGPNGEFISKRHTSAKRGPKGLGPQAMIVDSFFQEYYQSAGEPLPRPELRKGPGKPADSDILYDTGPWLNHGDKLNGDDDDSYNPDRPAVNVACLVTLACLGFVVGLPVRFLHHATLWSLYWQFVAYWETLRDSGRLGVEKSRRRDVGNEAPSFSTFQRRWHDIWRHYLRFRKSSEHAQCNTCWELQQRMFARGNSIADKIDAARCTSGSNVCTYCEVCDLLLSKSVRLSYNTRMILLQRSGTPHRKMLCRHLLTGI